MNVAQIWTIIGVMGTSLLALVTAMFWLVSVQGVRMREGFETQSARMSDGFAGIRNELSISVNGLRNEMIARFDHVDTHLKKVEKIEQKVETIDREVHNLTLRVFGGDPPQGSP